MLDKASGSDPELEGVLAALKASLAIPFEEAVSMPPRVYTSEGVFQLERENIFAREWHCAGRADELSEPGAYVTLDIAGEPVFAVCDREGNIRAFSNVCRHRCARLLEGRGKAGRIVCPYHAWVYNLDGSLMSAPMMPDDFDANGISLPEIAVENWRGWIYINLDRNAPPLFPRIEALDEEMANYHMERYTTLFVTEEIWDTNWKCLVENFSEAYHVFAVHPTTVDAALPTRLGTYPPGGEGFFRYCQKKLEGVTFDLEKDGTVLNDDLTEEQRETYPIVGIFPAHVFSISEDRLFWLALQPHGIGQVKFRWGVSVYPGAVPDEGRDAHAAKAKAALDKVNSEDRGIIENIYRGASSNLASSGRLSPKERCLWEFKQYYAQRLCG